MLKIKTLTVKNFMSVGNVTQAIHLDRDGLTLVLGQNNDNGGDGSRNGTGKTTIVNALSYALYGNALTNIRKDNLVNKTNERNMLVTVDFEKNGHNYRIERGRKPNIFRFVVDDSEVNASGTDEGQGENRLTQEQVERVVGVGHEMFKHIMALNTYTEPFLSMRAADQKDIIEELLGITQLSEKAEILKEQVKSVKDSLKEQEIKIKTKQESNAKITASIEDLERRSRLWVKKQEEDISKLQLAIAELEKIDIDVELENHKLLVVWNEKEQKLKRANKDLATHQSTISRLTKTEKDLEDALALTLDHKCHACGQDVHDASQEDLLSKVRGQIKITAEELISERALLTEVENKIKTLGDLGPTPKTKYASIDDAVNHKSTVDNLYTQLENRTLDSDPYVEQIDHLKNTALEEITYDEINRLNRLLEHQEFLLKLLTNKDSFIRKRIVEQNLTYLNHRLGHYLEKLGLPHSVNFQSDLTVNINLMGQEFDFDNLSRGERNRLILGLSWSFRDVYESLNSPSNLIFIDEMVDSGMDPQGVDNALAILKKMGREQGKNVFLISHRDELIGRVSNTLQVVKENGFTTFNTDVDMIET